jgi:hypothetical protein
MKKCLHSMFEKIPRTNNLKELSFISISSIRSRGAFDAARDWRDAHPEAAMACGAMCGAIPAAVGL